ncbi:MAG: 6-bladed beta-propeller [Tannerella sp.]|jgi:hypothetical protein|nr:6-bladed beta-propeller [Tannerella sp.]
MKRLFFVILIFYIAVPIAVCQSTDLIVIDLENPQEEVIPMSRFFQKIEYVPLEVNEFCPMTKLSSYYITDQHIVGIHLLSAAYLFDRKTGHFIHQISREGVGEEEYRRFPLSYGGFDEKNKILFFHDVEKWKGFDINLNKLAVTITMPKYSITMSEESPSYIQQVLKTANQIQNGWLHGEIANPYPFGDDQYIGYVNNSTGDVNVKLVIFDKQGHVIHSFPNDVRYTKVTREKPLYPGKFYNYNNKVYLIESFADTVFAVYRDRLEPHIVFKMGDKKINYVDAVENITFTVGRYDINFVKETDSYVFFKYIIGAYRVNDYVHVNGYYDKKLKQTFICKMVDGKAFYTNDIDGLPDFNPKLITNTNEFLGVLWPEDLQSNSANTLNERVMNIVLQAKTNLVPIIVIAKLR